MSAQELAATWLGTSHTAREIAQQPSVWRKLDKIAESARSFVNAWVAQGSQPALNRIILCGAGTSAYIGEVLAPHLRRELGIDVRAISTTDIVSAPFESLLPQTRTLMVSFGRSGDSPESVAAVAVANQVLADCSHLIVTCNAAGQLASIEPGERHHTVLLPAEALDQSFAMTSSFTAMLLTVAQIFLPNERALGQAATLASQVIENAQSDIELLLVLKSHRIVFLGSGPLYGVAREAALKILELTAGDVDCYAETALGFRHGPKSVVSGTSINVLLPSNDAYTRKYDDELWRELVDDDIAARNVRLDDLAGVQKASLVGLPAPELAAVYIVFCQILALKASLLRGISPDNPCPGGQVNRVVQGVTIHPLAETQ